MTIPPIAQGRSRVYTRGMSEQGKSNLQVFGAGAGAFALVVAIGGAALAAYSKLMAAAPAAPAAAPIDITAHAVPGAVASSRGSSERRAESPAPLIGDMAEPGEGSELDDALSASPSKAAAVQRAEGGPVAASAAPAAPKLQRVESLKAEGASTTAAVEVKTVAAEKKDEKKDGKKAKNDGVAQITASESAAAPRGEALASTVQYGVTDRSALMGRAAGPVYNLKGGAPKQSQAARMKGADSAAAKLEEARQSASKAPLTSEEKALLDEQLKKAGETLAPAGAQ